MRILFLGDIVGKPGRDAVIAAVPTLRLDHKLDAVIVNGENAAHGYGITEKIYHELIDCGVDVITLGNHSFDQREAMVFIGRVDRMIRPVNYPPGTPGKGSILLDINGQNLLVINAMGRVFMEPIDCPFRAMENELISCPLGAMADAIVVDFHAEATSEKQIMGHFCDGRASLVVGTHTHVPTADTRILKGGTAYQTDGGMCGDYDSVIGVDKHEPMRRIIEKTPGGKFEPAGGQGSLSGVIVETGKDGLAISVKRLLIGPSFNA
jgi:2',3'-cyclic-nucleotide 2'-phosphodiesterase